MHYDRVKQKEFLKDSTALLQAYHDNDVKLVAWRETSAQHFKIAGGHFPTNQLKLASVIGSQGCHPMQHFEDEYRIATVQRAANMSGYGWRDMLTDTDEEMAKANNTPELIFLPFRNFSSAFWDLHASDHDCSHFCSTPHLWMPIWRMLRLAMDRTFE